MRLHVGCEFQYESAAPTPAIVLVEPHPGLANTIVDERWRIEPDLDRRGYRDVFGNQLRRVILPPGPSTLRYDAIVELSGEPDPVMTSARQHPVEELPDDVLAFTLASRYCLTETLSSTAWHLFGNSPPGWARVQAVCDWIHVNVRYGALRSTPTTTAVDVYVAGGGICRDFAHLAVTFCRALNIPARYVFGYMPDIGEAPPYTPMDFHAWFEVYLEGRWWTFDARFNRPRIGRIPIGFGRDAVDVAMVTSYGSAMFRQMTVWSDAGDAIPDGDVTGGTAGGERSEGRTEARVVEAGNEWVDADHDREDDPLPAGGERWGGAG